MRYICVILSMLLSLLAVSANARDNARIRISFASNEAVVTLLDNPLAKEFLAMLPLDASFEDFAHTEKIFYLPRKLNVTGGVNADKAKGDFCYFAPWGNIAAFYKGFGHGASLYVLGSFASGKEAFAKMKGNFPARIEATN